jgi:hypothetical protein
VRRQLLLGLPALAAGIVAWAVLGGEPRRVEFARVLGGPTPAGASSSVLVGVWALGEQRPVPVAGLSLRFVMGGRELARGTTDASGHLETALLLEPSPPGVLLRVERADDGAVLAEGELALDVERWRATARREGGWLPGSTRGELGLEVAVREGVLAVPFEGKLIARVLDGTDESAPALAGAALELTLVGAERTSSALPPSDTDGVEIALRPLEHSVSARLIARSGARQGEWYGALPVVPGALTARLHGGRLSVSSPIVRERAFVSLITEHERLCGAIVELDAAPDGTASGHFEPSAQLLARIAREPTWAVVSSEDDKRSPGVVGWPLGAALTRVPATTFALADHVLLDGQAGALAERAARGAARRRTGGALLGGIGVLLGGAFWLEVRARSRRQGAIGGARDGWFLAAALVSIALGVGALAYFGALER